MLIHKILLGERLWNIAYFYTQETKTQKYSGFWKKKRNPVPDHDKLGSPANAKIQHFAELVRLQRN